MSLWVVACGWVYLERQTKRRRMGMDNTDEVPDPPLLLSAKIAARVLGVTDMQLRHLVAEGRLPDVRIKNRMFIPSASVHEFVESIRASA